MNVVFVALLVAVLSLFVVLLFNAFVPSAIVITMKPCSKSDEDFISLTPQRLDRFLQGLRYKTVSYEPFNQEYDELVKLVKFITESYPRIFNSPDRVNWRVIANYSLLIKVKGSDQALLPALFMSHLDVVPTENQNWSKDPFSAKVDADEYIYARGAIDDKHGVFGILEALEYLLTKKWSPKRTFYVAFGHDEEVHGYGGAGKISEYLRDKERIKKLEFISDEGLMVSDGAIPMFNHPAILIGIAEKGFADVKLTYEGDGGHSSMPPSESAIGILSKAIARLEENPQPSLLGTGPEKLLLEAAANEMNVLAKFVLRNIWFFKPLLSIALSKVKTANAIIRTTTATTIFKSGFKANVLPHIAEATVNHRIHPSQSIQQVLEHDIKAINDPRVKVVLGDFEEPSPVAGFGPDCFGYQVVAATAQQIFPEGVVLPAIMIAKTDTPHFINFTKNIYRFSPNHLHARDTVRIHGADERISVQVYEKTMNFYYHLFKNADQDDNTFLAKQHSHKMDL